MTKISKNYYIVKEVKNDSNLESQQLGGKHHHHHHHRDNDYNSFKILNYLPQVNGVYQANGMYNDPFMSAIPSVKPDIISLSTFSPVLASPVMSLADTDMPLLINNKRDFTPGLVDLRTPNFSLGPPIISNSLLMPLSDSCQWTIESTDKRYFIKLNIVNSVCKNFHQDLSKLCFDNYNNNNNLVDNTRVTFNVNKNCSGSTNMIPPYTLNTNNIILMRNLRALVANPNYSNTVTISSIIEDGKEIPIAKI